MVNHVGCCMLWAGESTRPYVFSGNPFSRKPCHVLFPLPVSADDGISAEPRKMAGNEITPDRRHSLRHKVNTPAFASFDGVTVGVILDLSEDRLPLHTATPVEPHRNLTLHPTLSEATR